MNTLRKLPANQVRQALKPRQALSQTRYASSSGLHFYRNKQLELWAAKTPTPLTLRQLVFYGRSMNAERLINSGNYVRTELPIRISHRIRDMQALPYVVVTQDRVAKVYELYWEAFEKIRQYPIITSLEDNDRFCEFIQGLLNEHSPVIPNLALGLSLASSHLSPDALDSFFRRMLVSRISRRVICEHHIALSDTMADRHPDGKTGHVGIIYSEINIKATIDKCIDLLKRRPRDVTDDMELQAMGARHGFEENWPIFKIDGHLDTNISYIRSTPASSSVQAKLFPLFYPKNSGRSDATASNDGQSETTRESRASASSLADVENVSSPPEEASSVPAPQPSTDASPGAKLISIFNLPVPTPTMKKTPSTSSMRSTKSLKRRRSNASDASRLSGLRKSLPGSDNDDTKRKRSTNRVSSRRSSVGIVHVVDDEEDGSPAAGPSSQTSTTRDIPPPPPAPAKPPHPFFAPRNPQGRTVDTPLVIEDDDTFGRVDNPIRLPSTTPSVPPKDASMVQETTATCLPRRRKNEGVAPPFPSPGTQHVRGPQRTFGKVPDLPFPPRTKRQDHPPIKLPQLHIALPHVSTASASSPLPNSYWQETTDDTLQSIPPEHLAVLAFHPLLEHINEGLPADDGSRECWTDRWRPQRADHVLGNEDNAQYLKAWLQTLELGMDTVITSVPKTTGDAGSQGQKGKGKERGVQKKAKQPVVVRAVQKVEKKKKKRKNKHGYGSDDWITDSEESEETDYFDDFDDFDEPLQFRPSVSPCKSRRTLSPTRPHAEKPSPAYHFSPLTNTILLSGPHGSGKTAAVYACAEELGWEVYEVYPGMGKRSGTNLQAIMDGVGKNHVLGFGRRLPFAKTGPITTMDEAHEDGAEAIYVKPRLRNGTISSCSGDVFEKAGDAPEMEDVAGDDEIRGGFPSATTRAPVHVQQSLILLEEVDVLFTQDRNFWSAVIDLVAASRRPVVMTCNDVQVVPSEELPLQATLAFVPPSRALMTSYIRCLGLAYGTPVSQQTAETIVEGSKYRPISAEVPDQALHPLPTQTSPTIDLRRAIHQLQIEARLGYEIRVDGSIQNAQNLRGLYPENWVSVEERLCDWAMEICGLEATVNTAVASDNLEPLWVFMDLISVVDSNINRRPGRTLEALAIDRYSEGLDDEIGHRNVPKIQCSELRLEGEQGVAFYGREEEMALECLAMARGYLEGKSFGAFYRRGTCQPLDRERMDDKLHATHPVTPVSFDSGRLFGARADHQRLLVEFVDAAVDTADIPLLPRAGMILDYVAYIQAMVGVDDEVGTMGGISRKRGRMLRQSSARVGSTQERKLTLGAGGEHAARRSRLVD
ncbi:hypothetical protein FRB99_008697 [Tulasnella sp. 403]|nr:hypothetical protein FRB99_008697 [Tulasnella sp. 403]